jgi:hypothetical protein
MRRAAPALLVTLFVLSTACRRENPAPPRTATAAAVAAANREATAVVATATAVVEATALAARPSGAPATTRRGKVAAGNLGVAASGISAGIQLWSRPGGVMAGGATMTGTITDGTEVDIVSDAEFLGQKYFQIRGAADASKQGWIEARFLQVG